MHEPIGRQVLVKVLSAGFEDWGHVPSRQGTIEAPGK